MDHTGALIGSFGQKQEGEHLTKVSQFIPSIKRELKEHGSMLSKNMACRERKINNTTFKKLLENAQDAVFIHDGIQIIDCNEKMFQIFVAEHHEVLGETPFGVSPEFQPDGTNSLESAHKVIKSAMQGEPQFFEWLHKKKDGTLFYSHISLFLQHINGKPILFGIIKENTKINESEQNIKLAADIFKIFDKSEDLDILIAKILAAIKNSTGFDSVHLRIKKDGSFPLYLSSNGPVSYNKSGTKAKTAEISDTFLERLSENIMLCRNNDNKTSFSEYGSLIINYIPEFLKNKSKILYSRILTNYCKGKGYESLALIPLKSGSDVIGILQINDSRPNRFTQDTTNLLELIASSTSRAIRESGDKEEILRNEARFESLLNIAQYKTTNIQDLLDMALDEAIRLTKSKIGYIYYYDENRKQFVLNSWSKGVMNLCSIVEPQTIYDLEKTGYWGEVVRQRKSMINNHFQLENKLKKGYPKGHCPLSKFMGIPVIINKQIMAVVGLANKPEDYTEKDVRQVTLLMEAVWKLSVQKKAEITISENEEKFRGIVENSADSIILTDEAGKIISWNKASDKIMGLNADEVMGKFLWDIQYQSALPQDKTLKYYDSLKSEILKKCQNGISDHDITLYDSNFINASGGISTIETRLFTVKTEHGFLLGSISRDITQTKQLQQELIESRELYRTFIDSSTDMAYIKDAGQRYMMVNKSFASFYKKPEEKIIGEDDFSLVPKEKAEEIRKVDKAVLRTNKMVNYEDKFMDKVLERRKFPVKLHDNIVAVGGYIRDVTELKRTREEEIRHLNGLEIISKTAMEFVNMKYDSDIRGFISKKLKQITKSSIIIVTSYHYDSNKFQIESIAGLKSASLKKAIDISGGDLRNFTFKVSPNSIRTLTCGKMEFLGARLKSFIIRTMTDKASALLDFIKSDQVYTIGLADKEQLLGSVLLINPEMNFNKLIVETFINQASIAIHNKSIVNALQQSEGRFRNLFEKNNDIIFTLDDREQITSINPIGQKLITGAIEKKVRIRNYMTSESYNRLKKTLSACISKKNKYCSEDIELYALNGNLLAFQVSFSISYHNQAPVEIFGIAQNITRNKMMQNQILSKIIETEEREKKSFAEELHDGLGSLLSTINIYVGLLQKKDKSQEQKDVYLDQLKKLVYEAVSNVRLFANSLTPNVLNDFGLISAIKLFCDKINTTRNGLVKFFEPDNLPRLDRIVEINLYRITLELINNSLKYANASAINIHIISRDKNIILQYNDNGKGFEMDKILLSGTSGMGTKNIIARVKSLNGTCDFHSQENKGVNFNIIIPRSVRNQGAPAQKNG